jgi:hypothetical protein
MLINTKVGEGPCPLAHPEELKEQFEKAGDPYMYDDMIERDFTNRLADIDRTIRRAQARVEEENKADELINPETNPDVLRLQTDATRLTADAEAAARDGNFDECIETMLKVDGMLRERDSIVQRLAEQRRAIRERTGVDLNKKLRVCDVCGSMLSILDSDKRLADHFLGKQHIGFQTMRETVDAIRKRREERGSGGGGGGGGGGRYGPSGGAANGRYPGDPPPRRDRSRDRSRDRGDRGGEDLRYSSSSNGNRGRRDNSRDRDRDRDRRDRDWDRGGRRDYYGGGGGDDRGRYR